MKTAVGITYKYWDAKLGLAWEAGLSAGPERFYTLGHKKLKDAITICNRAAKRLGWEMKEPWTKVPEPAKKRKG